MELEDRSGTEYEYRIDAYTGAVLTSYVEPDGPDDVDDHDDYDDHDDDDDFFLGPVGTLGFGFTLKDIPLTLGLDYRPMIAINVGDDCKIIDSGFKNLGVTLTYRF